MDTKELLATLRGHYIAETDQPGARDGGVFASEVAMNGSWGGPGTRRADALYAGFTSASGRILIGHEIKVSRSDWRNELTKVGKADAWADACHAWYIVAPSTDIVPPEELPDGWGLMLPPRTSRGRRMKIEVKAAVKPEDHAPPWWAVRSLMARLETLGHQEMVEQSKNLAEARVAEMRKRMEDINARRQADLELEHRAGILDGLERELGVEIAPWRTQLNEGKVSVAAVARGARIAAMLESDSRALERLDGLLEDIAESVARLRNVLPEAQALAGAASTSESARK